MATKTIISWEKFVAAGKEGEKCEWVDGEVLRMTPVNIRHEAVLKRLYRYLLMYCDAHSQWDWFPSNATFTVNSGNWRCPDASLVRSERFPAGQLPENRLDFPPDIAFEILSPSDRPGDIPRKRQDYQESGVIQFWIDPDRRLVELIYPDRPLQYFLEGQTIVIDSIPDFTLPLISLFAI